MTGAIHTPPLGLDALTPIYDRAIALFTREKQWRRRLVQRIAPKAGETILDIGSGTGSLALLVSEMEPRALYRGIDPDARAVEIARQKCSGAPSATFAVGFLPDHPASPEERADKVVSSLVLHQVPTAEKTRLIRAMHAWLKPGGSALIADYGLQRSLAMRLAFRSTVQLLDGVSDTQPNADGIIPELLAEAGFRAVTLADHFATPSGSIDIIIARKDRKS